MCCVQSVQNEGQTNEQFYVNIIHQYYILKYKYLYYYVYYLNISYLGLTIKSDVITYNGPKEQSIAFDS